MSEELRLNSRPSARHLRPAERALLDTLLATIGMPADFEVSMACRLVEDMDDGGMGSIRFLSSADQANRTAQFLMQAEYIDEDGVPVRIAINIDQNGHLFEVDFWKVDFSPLKRYPMPSDVKIVPAI